MPERNARTVVLSCVAVFLILAGFAAWQVHAYSQQAAMLRAGADAVPGSLVSKAISNGARVYQSDCANCHGGNAKGDAALGMPDLTDKDWLFGTGRASEIEKIVRHGIRAQDARGQHMADMPAYAQALPYPREKEIAPLSPGDVRDVVQYVLSLQKRESDALAAARGLEIFNGRGACWDCHGDNARGDNASGSPNLADAVWLYGHGSAADIARSIEGGHLGVMPGFEGRLSAAAILEVSLYVQSLSQDKKSAP